MIYMLTKLFFSLPDWCLLWLSGRPQMTTTGDRKFDPAGQLFTVMALKQRIFELDHSKSVPELREWWNSQLKPFEKPSLKDVAHRDFNIDVDQGSIRIREYTPRNTTDKAPAIVYLHGGGFTVFDIESCQGICEYFAKQLGAKVYAVGYRLAPEHPYPIPLEDCCAAFAYVMANADELGVDPARISIAGDSAGGNLSAALCLKRRDAGESLPKSQVMIYPFTDLTYSHPSIAELGEGHVVTKAHLKWFYSNYLPSDEMVKEPYVSPLFAPDHSGLPPAIIITAGFDLLRDEGAAYAQALQKAKVETKYKEFRSLGHGFMYADATAAVRKANLTICSLFREVL